MKSLISFSGSDRPYVIQKQLVGSSRRTPTNGKFAKEMSLVLTERNPDLVGGGAGVLPDYLFYCCFHRGPRSRTVRRLLGGSLDKL